MKPSSVFLLSPHLKLFVLHSTGESGGQSSLSHSPPPLSLCACVQRHRRLLHAVRGGLEWSEGQVNQALDEELSFRWTPFHHYNCQMDDRGCRWGVGEEGVGTGGGRERIERYVCNMDTTELKMSCIFLSCLQSPSFLVHIYSS